MLGPILTPPPSVARCFCQRHTGVLALPGPSETAGSIFWRDNCEYGDVCYDAREGKEVGQSSFSFDRWSSYVCQQTNLGSAFLGDINAESSNQSLEHLAAV